MWPENNLYSLKMPKCIKCTFPYFYENWIQNSHIRSRDIYFDYNIYLALELRR